MYITEGGGGGGLIKEDAHGSECVRHCFCVSEGLPIVVVG